MTAGCLIAFEGGEGAGKTTQIRLLSEYLKQAMIPFVATREPGGTPEGQELRRLLLTEAGQCWTALSETMLMIVDRIQHLRNFVRPAIDAGQTVISDRYVFSTLAYQGAGRGVSASFIRELHRTTCDDFWPDLTILLDIDPRLGLARSKRRLLTDASIEGRFEDLDIAFHDRVRSAFLDMAEEKKSRMLVIDAMLPVNQIQGKIRSVVGTIVAESNRSM